MLYRWVLKDERHLSYQTTSQSFTWPPVQNSHLKQFIKERSWYLLWSCPICNRLGYFIENDTDLCFCNIQEGVHILQMKCMCYCIHLNFNYNTKWPKNKTKTKQILGKKTLLIDSTSSLTEMLSRCQVKFTLCLYFKRWRCSDCGILYM